MKQYFVHERSTWAPSSGKKVFNLTHENGWLTLNKLLYFSSILCCTPYSISQQTASTQKEMIFFCSVSLLWYKPNKFHQYRQANVFELNDFIFKKFFSLVSILCCFFFFYSSEYLFHFMSTIRSFRFLLEFFSAFGIILIFIRASFRNSRQINCGELRCNLFTL